MGVVVGVSVWASSRLFDNLGKTVNSGSFGAMKLLGENFRLAIVEMKPSYWWESVLARRRLIRFFACSAFNLGIDVSLALLDFQSALANDSAECHQEATADRVSSRTIRTA